MAASPFIEPRGDRMVQAVVGMAALASAGILWWSSGSLALAGAFLATALLLAALLWLWRERGGGSRAIDLAGSVGIDRALLYDLADQSPLPVAVTDRAGRLVCANAAFLERFGVAVTPPNLAIEPHAVQALVTAGRSAWSGGQGRAESLLPDGSMLIADIRRSGQAGDHLVWRWANGDAITLASAAESAQPNASPTRWIEELDGRAGAMFESAGVMAVLASADGVVRRSNRAFALRALGDLVALADGQPLAPLLSVDQAGLIHFSREAAHGAATPLRLFEMPVAADDGSDVLLLIVDEDGGAAERGIARGYVEAMLAGLPFGVALIDRDSRIIFANDKFRAAAGREAAAIRYPGDLVVTEDKGALADAIRRQCAQPRGTSSITVRLNSDAGVPIALGLTSVRGVGEAAVLLSLAGSRDENELKQQVAQAQKMQAVGQLAGGIAHDFNNILTGILGSCDLMLLRHTPGDSDYDDVQQIRSNANRAANLTRQLLAFSRQQTLRPQVVNLSDIVGDVAHLLQRLIGDKVKLDLHHGRGLGAVRADPGQLEQVIVNLAVNARDAMPQGGTLRIAMSPVDVTDESNRHADTLPQGQYALLEVSDDGQGIPPDVLPKIFDPFFTTKPVGQGTGLGLATVYGIVKQSGGFIFAESQRGEGTCFSIYLPVYRGSEEPASARKPVEPAGARSLQWGSGTILLVEDEDVVRAVAERALVRAGYTVITACDGAEGLARFEEQPDIDLVVSDVMMPELDGPGMAAGIRERRDDVPVLFMSGYAEEQLRNSITMPNVGFIPKPFSVAQLIDAVAQVHKAS